jgi:hypothetical protein
MEGHRRSPAVWMPELFVTTSLARFLEPEAFEDGHNFRRLEDGHVTHG